MVAVIFRVVGFSRNTQAQKLLVKCNFTRRWFPFSRNEEPGLNSAHKCPIKLLLLVPENSCRCKRGGDLLRTGLRCAGCRRPVRLGPAMVLLCFGWVILVTCSFKGGQVQRKTDFTWFTTRVFYWLVLFLSLQNLEKASSSQSTYFWFETQLVVSHLLNICCILIHFA